MKFTLTIFVLICTLCLFSCTKSNLIELPLTHHKGYGHFTTSMRGVSPYDDDENNPWHKTRLKVTGVPETWTNVKYGDIETNIYQTVYQNYHLGNISEEWYKRVQEGWNWLPDASQLSKEALKTKIAFAYTEDSTGVVSMIVDANNNLDFSDDEIFIPISHSQMIGVNGDSVAFNNSMDVTYERYINNKIVTSTTPVFIAYFSQYNMLMCNFPQYSTTTYKGVELAVNSDRFANLTFNNPTIAIMSDSLKEGERFREEELFSKNEYIEIKGDLYKTLGVNTNKNALILEKTKFTKNEIHSTQIGFKTFPFAGNDVRDEAPIFIDSLKGKYLLLDFWAVWCSPCREEIPALKELYEKTDRDRFEIIGIVCDSPLNTLEQLIEDHSISWTQILSTESNKIKEEYGITGYPTTFLVDPMGVIIAKDLRGEQLEERILELMKE